MFFIELVIQTSSHVSRLGKIKSRKTGLETVIFRAWTDITFSPLDMDFGKSENKMKKKKKRCL